MTSHEGTRRQDLLGVLELAKRPERFLSVYAAADPLVIYRDVRPGEDPHHEVFLRVKGQLDAARDALSNPELQKEFDIARRPIEDFIARAKFAERGLGLFASAQDGLVATVFLPALPAQDAVRFGPGADVYPALDVLEELEPVMACLIERNRATLLAIQAGEVVYRRSVRSPVPHKSRATTRADRLSAPKSQQYEAERERRHYRRVAELMSETGREYSTRRLFLAGPDEAVSGLRAALPRSLASLLQGNGSVPGYAGEAALRDAAVQAAAREERHAEETMVSELVTRAAKNEGAVLGPYATAYAAEQRRVHLLVLAGDGDPIPGRRCPACGHLAPAEETRCSLCQTSTYPVDLGRELVSLSYRNGTSVEIVHGPAAKVLSEQGGGMGGLLKLATAAR
ncbi:MAG: hypothetical protein HY685_06700 [Chloroflexi bacterium]|nr:hypothetical protein [Chloroflexota bacterium]